MLGVYPIFMALLALTFAMYYLYLKEIPNNIPLLKREGVDVSELLNVFSKLYPRAEEKPREELPAIRLIATVSGSVRMALVDVGGDVKVLRVGSQVGAYMVVNIERNYLVLSMEDKKVAVGFAMQFETSQPSSQPSSQASRSFQATISKGELERITADPGIMFRQIRLVPFVRDGRTRGFLFEWVEPGSIFERSGIRAGDVLLSINNQEIRSGEDAFRILQVLRNENSIKLNLQRGSEMLELSLRVE
ncbi:MAG: PDZ domain-containing protein [Aquificaceae bacterium]|nr:PDZ domain-containing protein [Aquificaceae bacterium]